MYARRSANATRVVLVATSLPCLRRLSPHRAPRQSSCSAGLVRLVAVLPALPRARHRFASPPGIQQQRPLRPSLAFDPCSTPRPLLHVPVGTKFFSETSPRPGYTKTVRGFRQVRAPLNEGFCLAHFGCAKFLFESTSTWTSTVAPKTFVASSPSPTIVGLPSRASHQVPRHRRPYKFNYGCRVRLPSTLEDPVDPESSTGHEQLLPLLSP